MPLYCAFGCKNTYPDTVFHVMPNPDKFPERFKAWVSLLGGKLETSSDYEKYKKKRICDIHFSQEHRNRYKRLNALAVPTLHLPGNSAYVTTMVEQQDNSDSQPTIAVNTQMPAAVFSGESKNNVPGHIIMSEHNYSAISRPRYKVLPKGNSAYVTTMVEQQDNSDSQPTIAVNTQMPAAVFSGESKNNVPGHIIMSEHNYSAISRPRYKVLPKVVGYKCTLQYYTRNKPLQRQMKYLQNEICRLRKKGQSLKERLSNAEKLSNDIAFQRVIKNITKPAQLFLHMQLQTTKKSKGRRFTMEEKILSSSLYKKSPKCYRLLCKYFTLPSTKTMRDLLSKIKLSPGINKTIFDKIKSTTHEMDACDRLCSLIFDEMSLTPQVTYNAQNDMFEGFACNKEALFADHVMVFMVKGVKVNFKQPVAYYFTSSLSKAELKQMIKSVIQYTLEAGLIITNTVCDQSPVNVGAITELVNETKTLYLRNNKQWRHDIFRINKKEIIPLYDTPHLIKGIRNNLITKDLIYIIENSTKIIKWDYFQMVYAADKSYGELRLLDKLTEAHVDPDKINKMRVKSATQLFSHSVAVVTEHLTARGDLPNDCRDLIGFVILIDNLFDSLNGSCFNIPNGKIFKGPVKRNSPHHKLWERAKVILKSTKYIKKVKVGDRIRLTETIAPSITNLIKTIEGMEYLWNILSNKYGLDAMLTRNFNQDPVENFFGSIRSYGVRNIAPNTVSFQGAFKALMLNNYSSSHSRRANCEEDNNKCLQSFEFFLRDDVKTPDAPAQDEIIDFDCQNFEHSNINDAGQGHYVCGWVLRKCLVKIVKGCQHCRLMLLENKDNLSGYNDFIKAKEYESKKWLCYPSQEVAIYFKDIQKVTTSFLQKKLQKGNIKRKILIILDTLVDSPFKCATHKETLKKFFVSTTLNVLIYSWCRTVNRILAGKLKYDGEDITKIAALNYCNKYKHYKNRK